MAKLIFRYTDELLEDCREASEIEFKVPDDMDIHEFKVMCVRLASSLGYQQTSIENSFGDLVWGSEDKDELKELLDGLGIKKTNK